MADLPPLNAMKAFEVAARTGSFTRAARELGVSSAAVSQQVRNLESFFGKELFSRTGNRLAMTDAGHAIYPQTSRALADLAAVAQRVVEGEVRPRLVVSVPYSLAEPWLAPRLSRLVDLYPRLAIDVRVEDDPVDFARHAVDLRVSYGAYHYPDLKGLPLFHDEVLPVCSPRLRQLHLATDRNLETVHESMFIHTNWGPSYASHPTWSDWFAHIGLPQRPDPAHGRRVGLSSLAAAAAREHLGIALAQHMLIRADLEAGRLVPLATAGLKLGQPYHAFFPSSRKPRREIDDLVRVLQD
jgi:LysR family glycine cleavage system transcriptional activator